MSQQVSFATFDQINSQQDLNLTNQRTYRLNQYFGRLNTQEKDNARVRVSEQDKNLTNEKIRNQQQDLNINQEINITSQRDQQQYSLQRDRINKKQNQIYGQNKIRKFEEVKNQMDFEVQNFQAQDKNKFNNSYRKNVNLNIDQLKDNDYYPYILKEQRGFSYCETLSKSSNEYSNNQINNSNQKEDNYSNNCGSSPTNQQDNNSYQDETDSYHEQNSSHLEDFSESRSSRNEEEGEENYYTNIKFFKSLFKEEDIQENKFNQQDVQKPIIIEDQIQEDSLKNSNNSNQNYLIGKRESHQEITKLETETINNSENMLNQNFNYQINVNDVDAEMQDNVFPQFKKEQFKIIRKRDEKLAYKKNIKQFSSPQMTFNDQNFSDVNINYMSPVVGQNTDEQNVFEKAQILAKQFDGERVSKKLSICKGKTSIKFRCSNNHTFFIDVDVIHEIQLQSVDSCNNCWCNKCVVYYNQCNEIASQQGLHILNGQFQNKIILKCDKRGHQFDITYSKKLQYLNCQDCKRDDKEEWKAQMEEERKRREQDNLRLQQELFEQARKEMQQQQMMQSQSSSYSSYQSLEDKINQKSKKETVEYIRNIGEGRGVGRDQYDYVYLVYKLINTPLDLIIEGMTRMLRDQAKQYFKRLAVIVHPDKNSHPLAKEAFQKLLAASQEAGKVSGKTFF